MSVELPSGARITHYPPNLSSNAFFEARCRRGGHGCRCRKTKTSTSALETSAKCLSQCRPLGVLIAWCESPEASRLARQSEHLMLAVTLEECQHWRAWLEDLAVRVTEAAALRGRERPRHTADEPAEPVVCA